MGKYRSKKKPYANMELKGGGVGGNRGGVGGKKKGAKYFDGSATLTAKKGRAKIKLGLGGGWIKNRPIEGVDIVEGNLSKGVDFTLPIGSYNFGAGITEQRNKFQENTPWGRFKHKGKPRRTGRVKLEKDFGWGSIGGSLAFTPGSEKWKQNVKGGVNLRIPFNKGGKVSKKNKKK